MNATYAELLLVLLVFLLPWQIRLVLSFCVFDQVTPTISGFVNETVTVECGVVNCGQEYSASSIYVVFQNGSLPQPTSCIVDHAHGCNEGKCYKKCFLKLQKELDGEKLYCHVISSNSRLKSVPHSSGIEVFVQTSSPHNIYDFKLEEVTSSFLKASWKPPENIKKGIMMKYEVALEVPHSLNHMTCNSGSCCFPTVKEAYSPEKKIDIQYEDTCNSSIMTVKPVAYSSANAKFHLDGSASSETIEIPPSDSLIDESTEIWLFLKSSNSSTIRIQFKDRDNCSCPARMPKAAEFRYWMPETAEYDIQTTNVVNKVQQEVCYNVIEKDNLIYPRKKSIYPLEIALENKGGKTTQSYQIHLSTFDSKSAKFNENGTTQCITIDYANDTAENPVIRGSTITFNSVSDESWNTSLNITKPKNKTSDSSVSDCHLSLLYNGAYVMCVADYNEEECAIQQTIVVASNPLPSTLTCATTSTITTTTTITTTSVHFLTSSITVNETCNSTNTDLGEGIGIGVGIGVGSFLIVLLGATIIITIFVVWYRKGKNSEYVVK